MLKYVKHYLTMLATVSCALTTIMSVTACDESVTESKGSSSVATVKDLGNCEASNEADLVYVKEAGAVYMCAD